jgi:hypothetical protein
MEVSMNAWQKETTSCQVGTEVCLEKAKDNPEQMKACLEEMEAAVGCLRRKFGQNGHHGFGG